MSTNGEAINKGYFEHVAMPGKNSFNMIARRYYGDDSMAVKISIYNDMSDHGLHYPIESGRKIKVPLYPECVGYRIFNVQYREDFNTQKVITIANMIRNATFYCVELDKYFFYNGAVFLEGLAVNLDCVEERGFR